jgi:predicted Zn-dependent protease
LALPLLAKKRTARCAARSSDPVEEITIAGNMKDMFQAIVGIGSDVLTRGNKSTGSILIEKMVVAGS